MTIEIYQANDDYTEYEQVGTFESGDWIEGRDQLDPEGFYDGAEEGLVLRDYDGPDLVALDADKTADPAEEHNPSEYDKAEPPDDPEAETDAEAAEEAQARLDDWDGGEPQ